MTTDRTQGLSEPTAAVEPVHRAITKGGMVRTACNVTWVWTPNETRRASYQDQHVTCIECRKTLNAAAGIGIVR